MKAYSLFVPLLLCAAAFSGCAVDNEIDWGAEATGFIVDIQSVGGTDFTSSDELLPLPPSGSENGIDIVLDISLLAAGADETPMDSDVWVRLSSRPGSLMVLDAALFVGNDVLLQGGMAANVKVRVWDVFGSTSIWVEDAGFKPRTTVGTISTCNDGKDNDGDGIVDFPDDSGCLSLTDDSEEPGSGAAGVSARILFDTPTLAELQGYFEGVNEGFRGLTPYAGEGVTVDKGNMVVTRVTTDGMYLTDTTATGDGYNHAFIYTFNMPTTRPLCVADEYDMTSCVSADDKPIPMRVCDKVISVGGAVSEFYGFTEVAFPVWDSTLWYPEDGPCEVPEPVVLEAGDFRGNGAVPMEAHESGLVMLRDVYAGTAADVVDCDYNGDGDVDFRDYVTNECSDECACREACNNDQLCVEINQYYAYGQWPVMLGGASGVKVWINSRESVPEFDPFAEGAPSHYSAIMGTLRNLSFLDPYPWIVEPRCKDDLVETGEPLPATAACVNPRTGE